jgi:DtxR family Mn-dependent transcriptional regulator
MGLIDTTEMYLKTIYECVEEGIPPLRARIAERLKQSGPTVSQTVGRMERDGLVHVMADRQLQLSESGLHKAEQVMRRHRLVECLLTGVIGLEWPLAHDEACRWEHVVSEEVERKLLVVLDGPTVSPYGDPIPGLAGLGVARPVPAFLDGVVRLDALLLDESEHLFELARISETLQTDAAVLAALDAMGLRPGVSAVGLLHQDTLALTLSGVRHELPAAVAGGLYAKE